MDYSESAFPGPVVVDSGQLAEDTANDRPYPAVTALVAGKNVRRLRVREHAGSRPHRLAADRDPCVTGGLYIEEPVTSSAPTRHDDRLARGTVIVDHLENRLVLVAADSSDVIQQQESPT